MPDTLTTDPSNKKRPVKRMISKLSHPMLLVLFLFIGISTSIQPIYGQAIPTPVTWTHLSSKTGDIPVPESWRAQTSTLILDIDRDGLNDFVISDRSDPGVAWFQRTANGWNQYIIETEQLPIEAGGAYYDIDRDGDLDVVMAGDHRGNQVWWWENPFPNYDPNVTWTRRYIKNGGANKHHDQIFGDFDQDGEVEFVFWNQRADQIQMAEIPADPRNTEPWPYAAIYDGGGEGLDQYDVDGDGWADLLGGGRWFKYTPGSGFTPYTIDNSQRFGRIAAGDLITGGAAEVVMVKGDGDGPLNMYTCVGGDPVANPDCWITTNLIPGYTVDHGHSLELADFNEDGFLDIFCAEMRLSNDNPDAGMWVFYGDGTGNFTRVDVAVGIGNHESNVGDLDGDGDIDILGKPFGWDTPRIDIWLNDSRQGGTLSLDNWERHVLDSDRPWRAVLIDSADINNDGLNDVVTGGWVYINPGDPSSPWVRQEIGTPLNNLAALHDFDGDGDIDILGTEGQGSRSNADFVWAMNTGGAFTIMENVPSGEGDFLQGVTVGRFQGTTDSVVLSWHSGDTGIQTLTLPDDPVNQNWTWTKIMPTGPGEALDKGDIDRDGDLDVLQGAQWLRNDTTSWSEVTLSSTSGYPDRVRLADINNDGRLDSIIGFEGASSVRKLAWYAQPADVNQEWAENIIAEVVGPMSIDVADMDRDGDLDVVIGEHNTREPETAKLIVFENADGSGTSWVQHLVYTGDEHHDGAIVVDIEGDGDFDIISIGWTHSNVLLYENKALDGTTAPVSLSPPTNLQATAVSASEIWLSWVDVAQDETAYHVDRSLNGGSTWNEIKVLAANATGYTDTTLSCSTTAHYRVRAFRADDGLYSSFTPAVSVNTTKCPGRIDTGIVAFYTLNEGSGAAVNDTSGVGTPLNLSIADAGSVQWVNGGLQIVTSTNITSANAAEKIITAVKASNAITVEGWITPNNITQDGPARIVSISNSSSSRNLTLGQGLWGSQPTNVFDVRMRTTTTNENGQPSLTSPTGSATVALTHIVYTRDANGAGRIYINGVQAAGATISGDLSNWDATYPLILANEADGGRPWLGTLHMIAFYDRALSAGEILQNYDQGAEPVAPKPAPATPTNLIATPASDSVGLAWQDNATDETAYQVVRSLDAGTSWSVLVDDLPVNSNSYTDTAMDCNTAAQYRVRAYRASDAAYSVFSETVTTTTTACTNPLNAPTQLEAVAAGEDTINLTWQDNATDETAFFVERSLDAGTSWDELTQTNADVTAYSDTSLTCGTEAHYRVRAYRTDGDTYSAYTTTVSASTSACPITLDAPTNLQAIPNANGGMTLSWQDNASAETAYFVESAATGANWSLLAQLAPDTNTFIDTTVTCATTISYRVRAYAEISNADVYSDYAVVNNVTSGACSADLRLILTSFPNVIASGSQISIVVSAINDGPHTAADAHLNLTLPTGLTLVEVVNQTCTAAANVFTCPIGSIAPTAPLPVIITLLIADDVTADLLSIQTQVSSSATDPAAGNNMLAIDLPISGKSESVSIEENALTAFLQQNLNSMLDSPIQLILVDLQMPDTIVLTVQTDTQQVGQARMVVSNAEGLTLLQLDSVQLQQGTDEAGFVRTMNQQLPGLLVTMLDTAIATTLNSDDYQTQSIEVAESTLQIQVVLT